MPFATNTLARLSTLSAWWVRLGILPELIEPGHPEQNGRHERMHRSLKAETTRPAAGSLGAQQRRFNAVRHEFNQERPHEALDQATPAACYVASSSGQSRQTRKTCRCELCPWLPNCRQRKMSRARSDPLPRGILICNPRARYEATTLEPRAKQAPRRTPVRNR